MRRIFFLLFIWTFSVACFSSDEITLHRGEVIKGKVSQTENSGSFWKNAHSAMTAVVYKYSK